MTGTTSTAIPAPDPLASLRAATQARASVREANKVAHLARRETNRRPKRSAAELQAIVERGNRELRSAMAGDPAEASASEVIAWAVREFGDSIAVACSMSDAVLPHLVSAQAPWVDVLFLDTGYHFAQTYSTRDAVETSLQVNIIDVRPDQTVAEQDVSEGKDLFARDPGRCCQLRKVEPLQRVLGGYEVWMAGVRRDDSEARAQTPLVTWDAKNGLVKINPIAAWGFDDVHTYATTHNVTLNPLLADGYPSIGCAPCTQQVAPGQDPRSGRWAGLTKTECGLHI